MKKISILRKTIFTGAFILAVLAMAVAGQMTFAGSGPITTVSTDPSSPNGINNWFKNAPLVTLTPDTTATTYYGWDDPSPGKTYKKPLQAPEGRHTLYYYSSASIDEPIKSRVFRVDTTRPKIILKAPRHRKHIRGLLTIKVKATDPDVSIMSSGMNEIRLYRGNRLLAKKNASSATFKVPTRNIKRGRRIFRIAVQDKAGNTRRISRHYYIDNAKPKIPVAYTESPVVSGSARARFYFRVGDRVSKRLYVATQIRGLDGKLLARGRRNRRKRATLFNQSMKTPADEGTYIYRIITRDYAGNRRVRTKKFKVANFWNLENVKSHLFELSKNIGVRVEGTHNEHRAADYIEGRLRKYGYVPERQSFSLPDGRVSYNVVARKAGADPGQQFVVGAHYDSKSPSPGANDNGTGTSVLLELARLLRGKNLRPNMVFVFFGAEERFGANRYPEHFGSRHFVSLMGADERRRTTGMISVDMVGVGNMFHVRSMRRGPMSLVNDLLSYAGSNGHAISFRQDYGWSDHDSFELVGIPAAWLEWRTDNLIHTTGDTYERVQWDAVDITGKYLSNYLIDRFKQ